MDVGPALSTDAGIKDGFRVKREAKLVHGEAERSNPEAVAKCLGKNRT